MSEIIPLNDVAEAAKDSSDYHKKTPIREAINDTAEPGTVEDLKKLNERQPTSVKVRIDE